MDEYYERNRLSSIRVDCTEEIREATKKTKTLLQTNPGIGSCPTKLCSPADTGIIFGVIAPKTRRCIDLVMGGSSPYASGPGGSEPVRFARYVGGG